MRFFVLFVVGFLAACAEHGSGPPASEYRAVDRAPEGQRNETPQVESIETAYFREGPPALYVRYRTTISVDDSLALTREAIALLQRMQPEAQQRRLDLMILSAVSATGSGYNFVFKAGPHGQWTRS